MEDNKRFKRIIFIVIIIGIVFLLASRLYLFQQSKHHKYKELASTDTLTKVANRLHFNLIMNQIVLETKRRQGVFSLTILDIDDFKQVNDIHGHDIGDEVLKKVASLLKNNLREQIQPFMLLKNLVKIV